MLTLAIVAVVIFAVLVYVVCGALAYARDFAYFQRKWPDLAEMNYAQDRRAALGRASLGPVSLLFALSYGTRYGLKWR